MKLSKRILTALICTAFVLSLLFVPAMAAADENTGDVLVVGVPGNRCPVFYQDEQTGEMTGIGVDLMREAAEDAGYTPKFVLIKEETLKDALDNEDYDVLLPFASAVSSTAGRQSILTYNLLQTPFTLVTRNSRPLPSLIELKVGMVRSLGGAAETVRGLFPGVEITLFETMDDCVKALRSGEVDALLHNSYVWSYVLQKPSYADLLVQPTTMFSMNFRAGTLETPEGQAIISRLNSSISKIPDTFRQAVILDYTSRPLYRYDFSDYLYRYGISVGLTVLLFIALILIGVFRHRAERLENEKKLQHALEHDSLTGLYNLDGFRKKVEEILRANPYKPYILCYTNIKNFKYINDSQSRQAGDDLLCFLANQFMEILTDQDVVGRIETDHFAILCYRREHAQMLKEEKEIFDPVRNYFIDRGQEMRIQTCTGVYILEQKDYRTINVDHMLDCARVAEKRVQDTKKEGFDFYNPDQWKEGKRIAEILGHLHVAIQNGELQVWYQPQVNYETGKVTGLEALCRWNHANLGWIQPSEFIPVLEETGLIYDLDCYVWNQVCKDLQHWNEQGKYRRVSVNLSRFDAFKNPDVPAYIMKLIQTYGLSADQLRVEITETAYVENAELLRVITAKLREHGIQVEMDDFGSGYSSLHMLKEVAVDRIKLDLHFLTGTGDAGRGRIIVSYMVQMVKSLGMKLIAEGVENQKQADFLKARGCTEMQGYYFHKPMTAQEYDQLHLD